MGKYKIASRFIEYYRRHGVLETCARIWLAMERAVWRGGLILFYSASDEIPEAEGNNQTIPLEIEQIHREEDIPDLALKRILQHWNERLMKRHIKERFEKGARLWLAKVEKDYAGFGWSIVGTSIEPYFFPLSNSDAHLFNFHIFPEYRGNGINPLLVNHMLLVLKNEKINRALIETNTWNKAQIRSLEKTYFHKLGRARKITILGKTIVIWLQLEKPFGHGWPND